MAKGTQEEMLVWINHADKGTVWKAQFDLRNQLEGTIPELSALTNLELLCASSAPASRP